MQEHAGASFPYNHERELRHFLYAVKLYGYNGGQARVEKHDDGGTTVIYKRGDWMSRDVHIGGHPFSGMQTVYYKDVVCFTMHYAGHIVFCPMDKIYQQIRQCLSEARQILDTRHPWRGPRKLRSQNRLCYQSDWQGDIVNGLIGREEVRDELQNTLLRIDYVGGMANIGPGIWYNTDIEVTLRKISLNDGEKERKFLLSFPAEENGFHRPGQMFDLGTEERWKMFLQTEVDWETGKNLPENYVPSTLFWILADGELAGIGKVRHYLNEALRKEGGHIGIGIAKEFRGKGIGKAALAQLADYAKSLGEEKVLVTNHADNIASRKMTEACGGKLEKIENGRSFYWL